MTKTEENRQRLINIANGAQQFYCIEYCVDIRGNITILGGYAFPPTADRDIFCPHCTEDYIWLYDKWHNGGDFVRRERQAQNNIKRDELVKAYLQFREQHPNDGYGSLYNLIATPDERKPAERSDIDAVLLELKRRNRQYIAELYGEQLPLDYDFLAEYDKK